MSRAEPLILVVAILALLWIVGARLNRISAPSRLPPKVRGSKITSFLHVTGLQDYQCHELKAIIDHGDESALCKFIAYYRPGFVELDHYLEQLRQRFLANIGKPWELASDLEKIAAANRLLLNDAPGDYDFNALSKAEVRLLLEWGRQKSPGISEDFLRLFGDALFFDNFHAYKQLLRGNEPTIHVPKRDPIRPLMDFLTQTGVVLKGRDIALTDRLRVLPLHQLNGMAMELHIRETFATHEQAVQALGNAPGSAILLAMAYSIEDLFFLNPTAVNVQAIERELEVRACYAKLITRPTRHAAPDLALSRSP